MSTTSPIPTTGKNPTLDAAPQTEPSGPYWDTLRAAGTKIGNGDFGAAVFPWPFPGKQEQPGQDGKHSQ